MKLLLFLSCLLCIEAKHVFNGTIMDAMHSIHSLTRIASLLDQTAIFNKLPGAGPYTIFAPNNGAIHDLGGNKIEAIKNDTELLEKIIKYHIALGFYKHSDLINDKTLMSAENDEIRINVYKSQHAITAEGCEIVHFDDVASNGVIHIINEVMLPPDGNIADILAIDPEFSIFYSLINGTKFVDIMNDNLLTLFAPNNAAIEKMVENTIPNIQANPDLKEAVLKYHLVHGILWTPGMRNIKLRTLSNDISDTLEIKLKPMDQHIFVGNARIINRDISAHNGVIHTINKLLLPPSSKGPIG